MYFIQRHDDCYNYHVMTLQRKLALLFIDNALGRTIILGFITLFTLVDRAFSLMFFLAVLRNAHRTSFCHWTAQVKCPENIKIGSHVTIGKYCVLGAKEPITIGDQVRIGRNVTIETGGLLADEVPPYRHTAKPILIEEGAILYANSTILGGVTIGRYSIVSAGCVVTKDVPPFTIVGVARRQEFLRRPSVRRLLAPGDRGDEKSS
jgi:acetyltransferase-like isoleucine patch superfamily enzyme